MARVMRRHPVLFHGCASLLLALLMAAGLWAGLSGRWAWPPWLGAWLFAINLISLVYYGCDKLQARRAGRRVPERVLHLLALAGGSAGAYAGMRAFRHKTLKGGFRVVFWGIIVLQLALGAWTVYQLM